MSLLEPGQTLQPGHSLYSENGNYSLWMQTDGNVVLYYGHDPDDPNFAPNDAHWATHTGPNGVKLSLHRCKIPAWPGEDSRS
jgi:hypothetical protein